MTPAVTLLKKAKIKFKVHPYAHDPDSGPYGEEAAEKLNIPFDQIFKTLIVEVDNNDLFVAVVPVSKKLHLKKFVKAIGSKKARMADKNDVERATGYVLGGVSPIGQKKKLTTIIDKSAFNFSTIYVSAGRRGLQIELSPKDLGTQTGAAYLDISNYTGHYGLICSDQDNACCYQGDSRHTLPAE